MGSLFVLIFLVMFVLVSAAAALGFKWWETERKKRVSAVLQTVTGPSDEPQARAIIERFDRESSLAAAISRLALTAKLRDRISQAGLDWPVTQFCFVTVVLAGAGALAGFFLLRVLLWPWLSAAALGALLGILPWVYVGRKRKKRLGLFEQQFPEALDLLSRAMRAGHAFTASLELLANESAAPLGPEFRRLYDEQNLGAPLETALRSLARRMPLIDVRFFVSAVLLQRETGGNLGEILRNLANVIRARFQLKGQVRAASAHGRITAAILTVLPFVAAVGMTLLKRDYLSTMANDYHGKFMILGALVLMALGFYIMRRIIEIKI